MNWIWLASIRTAYIDLHYTYTKHVPFKSFNSKKKLFFSVRLAHLYYPFQVWKVFEHLPPKSWCSCCHRSVRPAVVGLLHSLTPTNEASSVVRTTKRWTKIANSDESPVFSHSLNKSQSIFGEWVRAMQKKNSTSTSIFGPTAKLTRFFNSRGLKSWLYGDYQGAL